MIQQYYVQWNGRHEKFAETLMEMQKEEELVDVCMLAGGQRLKAHSLVLCTASKLFRELLVDVELGHSPIVTVQDVSYVDLQRVIDFIYSGEAVIDEDALDSFLETAKMLKLSGLEEAWEGQSAWSPVRQLSARKMIEPSKIEGNSESGSVQSKGKIRVRKDLMKTGVRTGQTRGLRVASAPPSEAPPGFCPGTTIPVRLSARVPGRDKGKRMNATHRSPVKGSSYPPGYQPRTPTSRLDTTNTTYECCERCGVAVTRGHMENHAWAWHGREMTSQPVRCPLCRAVQGNVHWLEEHLQKAHVYGPRHALKLAKETIMTKWYETSGFLANVTI